MSDRNQDNPPPPGKTGWKATKPNQTNAPKLRNKEPIVLRKKGKEDEDEEVLVEEVDVEEAVLVEESEKKPPSLSPKPSKQEWAKTTPNTSSSRTDKKTTLRTKGTTQDSSQDQDPPVEKKKKKDKDMDKDKEKVNNEEEESNEKKKKKDKEKMINEEEEPKEKKKASEGEKLKKEDVKKPKKKSQSTEESSEDKKPSSRTGGSNAISTTMSPAAAADDTITEILACWKKAINELELKYKPIVCNWLVDCHVVLAVLELNYVPKVVENSLGMTSADDMLCEALRYLFQTKKKINGEMTMIVELMAHPKTHLPVGLRERYIALDENSKRNPFTARVMRQGFDVNAALTGGWKKLLPLLEAKVGEKNPAMLQEANNEKVIATFSVDDIYHYNEALSTVKGVDGALIKACLAEATTSMEFIDYLAAPTKTMPGAAFEERKAEKIEILEAAKLERKAIAKKMKNLKLPTSKSEHPMYTVVRHAFEQVAKHLGEKKYSNASVTNF